MRPHMLGAAHAEHQHPIHHRRGRGIAPNAPVPRIWDASHRWLTIGLVLTVVGAAFEALAVATVLPVTSGFGTRSPCFPAGGSVFGRTDEGYYNVPRSSDHAEAHRSRGAVAHRQPIMACWSSRTGRGRGC